MENFTNHLYLLHEYNLVIAFLTCESALLENLSGFMCTKSRRRKVYKVLDVGMRYGKERCS